MQFNDPEFGGGANRSSLNEYRADFEAKLLASPNSFSDRRARSVKGHSRTLAQPTLIAVERT